MRDLTGQSFPRLVESLPIQYTQGAGERLDQSSERVTGQSQHFGLLRGFCDWPVNCDMKVGQLRMLNRTGGIRAYTLRKQLGHIERHWWCGPSCVELVS